MAVVEYGAALAEVRRLLGRPGFPWEAEPLHELVVALQTAQSEDHARGCITHFAQYEQRCPLPAQIRTFLYQSRPPEPEPERTIDAYGRCLCHGWGTAGQPPNARFCDCAAGRSLQKDILTWDRHIFQGVRPDAKGPQVAEQRKWTLREYLAVVNGTTLSRANAMPDARPSRSDRYDPAVHRLRDTITPPWQRREEKTTAEMERELAESKGLPRTPEEIEAMREELQERLAIQDEDAF